MIFSHFLKAAILGNQKLSGAQKVQKFKGVIRNGT